MLENAINNVTEEEKVNMKPVVIVGAGLSAADAVIACRKAGIKVIHVFRSVAGGFVSSISHVIQQFVYLFFFCNSLDCHKHIFPSTTWSTI